MSLHFRETPDSIVVFVADAGLGNSAQIAKTGMGLLEVCRHAASAGKNLIIDFQDVESMSSAMIGKFVLLNKLARQLRVKTRLANVGADVDQVFKICRLDKIFRYGDDGDSPGFAGRPAPNPKPPGTLSNHAEPPKD